MSSFSILALVSPESSSAVAYAESESISAVTPRRHLVPTLRIRPTKGWVALNLRELWSYRDLLWILVERNIKVAHKQTALGVAWVALQPLIAAIILAVIFGHVAGLPSDGAPYLLFVFCGLTAWNYFSQAMQRASNSLVNNAQLVSKVYFPKMLIPLSHVCAYHAVYLYGGLSGASDTSACCITWLSFLDGHGCNGCGALVLCAQREVP